MEDLTKLSDEELDAMLAELEGRQGAGAAAEPPPSPQPAEPVKPIVAREMRPVTEMTDDELQSEMDRLSAETGVQPFRPMPMEDARRLFADRAKDVAAAKRYTGGLSKVDPDIMPVGEMGALEKAHADYTARTGADTGDFNAMFASMGNMVGGGLSASRQNLAAQRLYKGDYRDADEQRRLFSTMLYGSLGEGFDDAEANGDGIPAPGGGWDSRIRRLARGIVRGIAGGGPDALQEWDETEGRRFTDPAARKSARDAFVKQVAHDYLYSTLNEKERAAAEAKSRGETHGARILAGGLQQVANMAPFALGPAGIAAQTAIRGEENASDLMADSMATDGQGGLVTLKEGDGRGRAALKGYGSAAFETAVEVALGKAATKAVKTAAGWALKGAGGVLSRIPVAKSVGEAVVDTPFGKAVKSMWNATGQAFDTLNRRTHIGGLPEENFEELLTAWGDSAMGLSVRDSELEGSPWSRLVKANGDFFTAKNLMELNESMLLMMGGGAFVASCVGRGAERSADDIIRKRGLMTEEELKKASPTDKAKALDGWAKALPEPEATASIRRGAALTHDVSGLIEDFDLAPEETRTGESESLGEGDEMVGKDVMAPASQPNPPPPAPAAPAAQTPPAAAPQTETQQATAAQEQAPQQTETAPAAQTEQAAQEAAQQPPASQTQAPAVQAAATAAPQPAPTAESVQSAAQPQPVRQTAQPPVQAQATEEAEAPAEVTPKAETSPQETPAPRTEQTQVAQVAAPEPATTASNGAARGNRLRRNKPVAQTEATPQTTAQERQTEAPPAPTPAPEQRQGDVAETATQTQTEASEEESAPQPEAPVQAEAQTNDISDAIRERAEAQRTLDAATANRRNASKERQRLADAERRIDEIEGRDPDAAYRAMEERTRSLDREISEATKAIDGKEDVSEADAEVRRLGELWDERRDLTIEMARVWVDLRERDGLSVEDALADMNEMGKAADERGRPEETQTQTEAEAQAETQTETETQQAQTQGEAPAKEQKPGRRLRRAEGKPALTEDERKAMVAASRTLGTESALPDADMKRRRFQTSQQLRHMSEDDPRRAKVQSRIDAFDTILNLRGKMGKSMSEAEAKAEAKKVRTEEMAERLGESSGRRRSASKVPYESLPKRWTEKPGERKGLEAFADRLSNFMGVEVRFSDRPAKGETGWNDWASFDRKTGTVTVYPGAKPSDIVHEMSHAARLYAEMEAKAGRTELLDKLNEIAESAPESVRRAVGKMTEDATGRPVSGDVLADEIVAYELGGRTDKVFGKSVNTLEGRAWYTRAWQAVKDLWHSLLRRLGMDGVKLDGFMKMRPGDAAKWIVEQMAAGRRLGRLGGTEGGGKARSSLASFSSGRNYVSVDTDQHLFDGKPRRDFPKIAREVIRSRFRGRVIGDAPQNAYVKSGAAGEYAYAGKPIDEAAKAAKMRSSTELDNLLRAGNFIEHRTDDGGHPEATGGWDYYETIFDVGGRLFRGKVNIMNTKRGRVFHDVTDIKEDTQGLKAQYGKPQDLFPEVSTADKVSQSAPDVKGADEKRSSAVSEESAAQREYDEVVARYTNPDGTRKAGWMKAPNGKPTNLTERQWVQVRTPAFKRWFGDWERQAELLAARDFVLNGGNVAEISGTEFQKDGRSLIDRVSEHFAEVGGEAVSPVLGRVVLNRSGVKSSVAHGIGLKKAAAFAAVKDVIEKGVVFDRNEDWKGRGYGTAVVAAPIRIGAEDFVCEVVVARKPGGNTFYLHEVNLKEKLSDTIKTATGAVSIGESARPVRSIIAQRLSEVNPAAVSKVVDGNGEPMVVKRGSAEDGKPYESAWIDLWRAQSIPDAAKEEVARIFGEIHRSPYGDSFYNSANISWNYKPDRSLRFADHWNFRSGYDEAVHCRTDRPVENTSKWTLAEYHADDGLYHVLKTYGAIGRYARRGTHLGNKFDKMVVDGQNRTQENLRQIEREANDKNEQAYRESGLSKFEDFLQRKYAGEFGDLSAKFFFNSQNGQVKSATDNTGAFSEENPDIRHVPAGPNHGALPNVTQPVDRDIPALELMRAKWQDHAIPIRSLQEDVGGVREVIDPADGYTDWRRSTDLYEAKDKAFGREELEMRSLKNSADRVNRILAEAGVKPEVFDRYLTAMHTRERNMAVQLRERGAYDPDDALGTGMSENEANAYLAGPEVRSHAQALEDAARGVYAINRWDVERRFKAGRLSAQERDAYLNRHTVVTPDGTQVNVPAWDHYVPLKTDMTNPALDSYSASTANMRPREFMRARGREAGDLSDSPFMMSVTQAAQGIKGSVANEVANVAANLVAHASAQGSPIGEIAVGRPETAVGEHTFSFSGGDRVRAMGGMRLAENRDDVQLFKRDGQLCAIRWDKGAGGRGLAVARAAQDADLKEPSMIAGLTKVYSALRTRLNPVFVVTNLAADSVEASLAVLGRYGVKDTAKFLNSVRRSAARNSKDLAHYMKTGALRGAVKEWAQAGGMIRGGVSAQGYADTSNELRDSYGKFLRRSKGVMGRGLDVKEQALALKDYLEDGLGALNEFAENITRVSLYSGCRDMGMQPNEAVKFARDATVNFNRKGWFMPVVNSMFAFANAAVQGDVRAAQSLKDRHGLQVAAGLTLLAFVNAAASHLFGNDDEREEAGGPNARNISEYRKQQGPQIPVGTWTLSPIRLRGINSTIYYTALKTAEVMFGEADAGDAAYDVLANLGDRASVFLGEGSVTDGLGRLSGPMLAQKLAPSVLDPFVQGLSNTDFRGARIYDEPYDPNAVRSESGRPDTGGGWKTLAKGVNRLTGGDRGRRGIVDLPPEVYRHIAESLLGGVGVTAGNLSRSASAALDGDMEGAAKSLPVVSTFARPMPDVSARYYKGVAEYEEDKAEYRNLNLSRKENRVKARRLRAKYKPGALTMEGKSATDRGIDKVRDLKRLERGLVKKGNRWVEAPEGRELKGRKLERKRNERRRLQAVILHKGFKKDSRRPKLKPGGRD